jgi:hypothetical protein
MRDQRPDVYEPGATWLAGVKDRLNARSIATHTYVSCGIWIAISEKEDGGFQSRQSNAGGKS